eukprot:852734-Pelagomonas_calceolata.AAC.1
MYSLCLMPGSAPASGPHSSASGRACRSQHPSALHTPKSLGSNPSLMNCSWQASCPLTSPTLHHTGTFCFS